MKIAIDKSALISELDTVSKAAPSGKVMLPILEGVLLEAHDNQLHFSRNNLDVAIKRTVGCEVIEPGIVVVNAKLFTDIIRRMPDEEIDITTNDKKMDIEAGNTHMEIQVVSHLGFPSMPEVKVKTSFEIDQQVLKTMVSRVAFAVAVDETRPSLTGICINAHGNMLDVVGIDGYMMAWYKTALNLGDLRILPKGVDLENICRLLDKGNVKVSASENLIELVTDNMRVTLRALDGEYMNFRHWHIGIH